MALSGVPWMRRFGGRHDFKCGPCARARFQGALGVVAPCTDREPWCPVPKSLASMAHARAFHFREIQIDASELHMGFDGPALLAQMLDLVA